MTNGDERSKLDNDPLSLKQVPHSPTPTGAGQGKKQTENCVLIKETGPLKQRDTQICPQQRKETSWKNQVFRSADRVAPGPEKGPDIQELLQSISALGPMSSQWKEAGSQHAENQKVLSPKPKSSDLTKSP